MPLLATASSPWGRDDLQVPRPSPSLSRPKEAAAPEPVYALSGRLYLSASGWLLLSVPNAIVRGLFDAMHEPGIELPPSGPDGKLCAHVSVLTADETAKIGPENISERGHAYSYQLGPMKCVEPKGWDEMARCWFVTVTSPSLQNLRKSYGLTPLPHGDHAFHITVACRRRGVLRDNDVSKAAQDLGPTPGNVMAAADAAGSFMDRAAGRAVGYMFGGSGKRRGGLVGALAGGMKDEALSRLPGATPPAGPRITLRIPATPAPPAATAAAGPSPPPRPAPPPRPPAPPAVAAAPPPATKRGALAEFLSLVEPKEQP